jgi:hypothetical protein
MISSKDEILPAAHVHIRFEARIVAEIKTKWFNLQDLTILLNRYYNLCIPHSYVHIDMFGVSV